MACQKHLQLLLGIVLVTVTSCTETPDYTPENAAAAATVAAARATEVAARATEVAARATEVAAEETEVAFAIVAVRATELAARATEVAAKATEEALVIAASANQTPISTSPSASSAVTLSPTTAETLSEAPYTPTGIPAPTTTLTLTQTPTLPVATSTPEEVETTSVGSTVLLPQTKVGSIEAAVRLTHSYLKEYFQERVERSIRSWTGEIYRPPMGVESQVITTLYDEEGGVFKLVVEGVRGEVLGGNYWEQLEIVIVLVEKENTIRILSVINGRIASGISQPTSGYAYEDMEPKYSSDLQKYTGWLLVKIAQHLEEEGEK